MSYTIDERNPERQQLLNQGLEPGTRSVLARLPAMAGARILDVGCGQGNTTRVLADALQPATCIGIDFDAGLVDYAATRPDNPASVGFQQGDATALPFPDASFDVAFCRYLLVHMADPLQVVREMLRVVKPGGFAIAFEGDFASEFSEPATPALDSINKIWRGLFPNPLIGRRLVHYFRAAGANAIQAGAIMSFEHDSTLMRRIYRLTAEATGPLAVKRGILDPQEAQAMIDGLVALENDTSAVLAKFPDMWVIATR